jgi:hypothetical protein
MLQLVKASVPEAALYSTMPPPRRAELPLTVQSVSVSVPPSMARPPP